jgi:hypothetical protein
MEESPHDPIRDFGNNESVAEFPSPDISARSAHGLDTILYILVQQASGLPSVGGRDLFSLVKIDDASQVCLHTSCCLCFALFCLFATILYKWTVLILIGRLISTFDILSSLIFVVS